MAGTGEAVDGEEDVAYVKGDVAAVVGVIDDVTHRTLPDTVEVDAYEVAVGTDDRAAGISA